MKMPDKIRELINEKALFVINDSAGKDSQAMKHLLIKNIPINQLVIVHAKLPEVDWDGNLEHIKRYSFGVPVYEVQAGKTFFEMVNRRGKFPSPSTRQCTSDLKRDPIQKFINRYAKDNGFTKVVNCMGLRAEESPGRAKKPVLKLSTRASCKHREQWEWLPIHDLTLVAIKILLIGAGQELHWAYKEGMNRLSCCFCIMSCQDDLKTAARLKPELAEKYMETEERLNFTMSMSRVPLRKLLNGEKTLPGSCQKTCKF